MLLRIKAGAACVGMWLALGWVTAVAQPADTKPSVERGRQLYHNFCARCHGMNMVTSGSAFFDLRTLTPQEHDRFQQSVTKGIRAMPAWGNLKPDEVESLWLFVIAGR